MRARASIGWKPIFLDDYRWQDRRRWVWNVDDKSITPSHANQSRVWMPPSWQAFWRSHTFFGIPMENLSQPVDKGSVASPVSQKFIRIYTSLQEWLVRFIEPLFTDIRTISRFRRAQFRKLFLAKTIFLFPRVFFSTFNEKLRTDELQYLRWCDVWI